jgi:hydroxymethylpyrimidine pyrophosphatase-like HAD family hydrolase
MVEFNKIGVSKGSALAWLSARLNIDRSQVLAIGNDLNDLEMLEWSGFGLAVSDSPAELLSVADEVVPAGTDVLRYAMERFDLAG